MRKILITLAVLSATLIAAGTAQARDHVSIVVGFNSPTAGYVYYPPPVVYRPTPVFVSHAPIYSDRDHYRYSRHCGWHDERNEDWHHGRGHGRGYDGRHWD